MHPTYRDISAPGDNLGECSTLIPTPRMAAEEELQKSENRSRLAMEASDIGLWDLKRARVISSSRMSSCRRCMATSGPAASFCVIVFIRRSNPSRLIFCNVCIPDDTYYSEIHASINNCNISIRYNVISDLIYNIQ